MSIKLKVCHSRLSLLLLFNFFFSLLQPLTRFTPLTLKLEKRFLALQWWSWVDCACQLVVAQKIATTWESSCMAPQWTMPAVSRSSKFFIFCFFLTIFLPVFLFLPLFLYFLVLHSCSTGRCFLIICLIISFTVL